VKGGVYAGRYGISDFYIAPLVFHSALLYGGKLMLHQNRCAWV